MLDEKEFPPIYLNFASLILDDFVSFPEEARALPPRRHRRRFSIIAMECDFNTGHGIGVDD